MTLQFLGRGGAFAPISIGNSNLLLTSSKGKRMLVDCGSTAPYILRDEWAIPFTDIDGVYISHMHADHIGGLEHFALSRYYAANAVRPKLFAPREMYQEMWRYTLKGGLDCVQGKIMNLTDYFDCQPITKAGKFMWEGYDFTVVPTVHIVSGYAIKRSYGLSIVAPGMGDVRSRTTLFTSDTTFTPDLFSNFYNQASLILHDCETSVIKSGVHSHYEDLRTLPLATRNRMWLYHYNVADPRWNEDGFAGFVEKGQVFEI